jgi:hypothetical protein
MRSPCCLCMCIPSWTFEYLNQSLWNLVYIYIYIYIYIITPEPISTANFINPSHQSVSVCVRPIVVRQRLNNHVPAAAKNCWRRRFLCGSHRVKESRLLVLPRISYYNKLSLIDSSLSDNVFFSKIYVKWSLGLRWHRWTIFRLTVSLRKLTLFLLKTGLSLRHHETANFDH